jgi:hypothetical protein
MAVNVLLCRLQPGLLIQCIIFLRAAAAAEWIFPIFPSTSLTFATRDMAISGSS